MSRFLSGLEMLEHQLHQAHRTALQGQLAAQGMGSIGHPLMLSVLRGYEDRPGEGQLQAQRELARLLNVSPAAVATSLKSLEKGGYIRREPEPGDARRNRVELTQRGRQAVDACEACLDQVTARMFADFSPQEREQLAGFYRRMLANLQREHTQP